MKTEGFTLNHDTCAKIIETLFQKLHSYYVFPEVARKIEASLRERFDRGEYNAISALDELCDILTLHMYEISNDLHLHLSYHPEARTMHEDVNLYDDPEWKEAHSQKAMRDNFGFKKVERLPGNIGYLELKYFHTPDIAGETAVATMNFLAYTNALIIDIRQNGGGEGYMVHLISSYLFDTEPVHLNDFYLHTNKSVQQLWTLPYVPGKRYGNNKPVYVLTSSRTYSAAEEFAYNLKNLKRATIIGETTGGAANPIDLYQINEYIDAYMPIGRVINAITGTNWEGTGVVPDIQVSQENALKVAHVEAVRNVLDTLAATSAETEDYKALEKEAQQLINGILSSDEEEV